jgi:TatD DNase family protein
MNTDFFIDTHAHLDGDEFVDDLSEALQRAQDANVRKILVPNISLDSVSRIKEICESNHGVLYPMIGLHPEDVKPGCESSIELMESKLREPNHYIAIGEIGLDYYWDDTYKELQKEVFKKQIAWALKYDLPLMIHTRAAHKDMTAIIKETTNEYGDSLKGVFHCFSGNEEEARELLKFKNFMIGIGGICTFKKSELPQVLRTTIPLERIVLETDAPYMAPVPNRGKRNESAFIKDIASKLAEIYGCDILHVMNVTTRNALSIFSKAQ